MSSRFNDEKRQEAMENQPDSVEVTKMEGDGEEATKALEQLSVSSGGAAGKYKKKPKKGKKKAKF